MFCVCCEMSNSLSLALWELARLDETDLEGLGSSSVNFLRSYPFSLINAPHPKAAFSGQHPRQKELCNLSWAITLAAISTVPCLRQAGMLAPGSP
jgi:hypothetical protein